MAERKGGERRERERVRERGRERTPETNDKSLDEARVVRARKRNHLQSRVEPL